MFSTIVVASLCRSERKRRARENHQQVGRKCRHATSQHRGRLAFFFFFFFSPLLSGHVTPALRSHMLQIQTPHVRRCSSRK
jgi:hypothetical protein